MAISTPRNDMELGSVTNWPAVYAAAGVGAFLLVGLAAIGVIALTQAAPAPTESEAVVAVRPVPPPRPAGATPHVPPAPAAKPSEEAPVWKPLVPAPTPVTFPVVKRIVVPPDLISVAIPAPLPPLAPAPKEREVFVSNVLQANVRQIDLDAVEGTALRLLVNADRRDGFHLSLARSEALKKAPSLAHGETVLSLMASRADLSGLPVRGEPECRALEKEVKCLEEISPHIRTAQACADVLARKKQGVVSTRDIQDGERDRLLIKLLSKLKGWENDKYSSIFAQMLCVETPAVCLHLTKMLSAIKGPSASVALARQTLFDLSPQVRQAAIQALTARPREEYRKTLLDGLRYPLPAVADRAAEALMAVEDRGAAADLEKLLDRPDPAAPVCNEKKKWMVAEIVKVNHLRNCVLCHAPAKDRDDPVLGFVPQQGEPIPASYDADSHGGFVRADVTYLRQDFSLMEDVPDPGKWPARQRFDYIVRQRELTDQEITDRADSGSEPAKAYPQREAVRRALEKLTVPDHRAVGAVGLGP